MRPPASGSARSTTCAACFPEGRRRRAAGSRRMGLKSGRHACHVRESRHAETARGDRPAKSPADRDRAGMVRAHDRSKEEGTRDASAKSCGGGCGDRRVGDSARRRAGGGRPRRDRGHGRVQPGRRAADRIAHRRHVGRAVVPSRQRPVREQPDLSDPRIRDRSEVLLDRGRRRLDRPAVAVPVGRGSLLRDPQRRSGGRRLLHRGASTSRSACRSDRPASSGTSRRTSR